jgi:hypothetical protein
MPTKIAHNQLNTQILHPEDFGFASANTAAQNKSALQYAIASASRPCKIQLPAGIFNITPDIDMGNYVIGIQGAGPYATALSMSGGTKCFYSNLAQFEYFTLKDMGFFATSTDYAFYAEGVNHTLIENVLATGFDVEALYLGGYSNDVVGCHLYSNPGSGLNIAGTCNNVNVVRNRIYANGGIGLIIASTSTDAGLQINVEQNAIEQNAVAGILARNTKALNLNDNYFERNSVTGYTFAAPETINIAADIILLASASNVLTITDGQQNKGPTISGNHSTPNGSAGVGTANLDGFIFTNWADSLTVENNQMFDDSMVDSMVCLYANRAYSKIEGKLNLRNNSQNTVGYKGTRDANTEHLNSTHLIDIDTSENKRNYANKNFLTWGVLSGSTGTLVRAGNFYNGQPSFSLTDGDIQWGNQLDLLNVYQELRGKWVYFGMWVNDQGSNSNVRMYIDGQSSRSDTPAGGFAEWQFQSVLQYIDVAATTLGYGMKKVGTGGGHLVNNPILTVVGNSFDDFPTILPEWESTAAPTTGTWVVGDRVRRNPPVAGQPKGWSCTVAGTPGTWVSEGNL